MNELPSVENLYKNGFAILPNVFERAEIENLIGAVGFLDDTDATRNRGGVYAVRNLLSLSPAIFELAHSELMRSIVELSLGKPAYPVRGMLFDKTAGANWLVPWHQDLTICVEKRIDVPGYGQWTMKAGVCHVQPPVAILDGMLSVRIHLGCRQSRS